MALTLSLLDQSLIAPGDTAEQALRNTIEIAKLADRLGYHRFWVSEHHDSDQLAGSSPEVLLSHLAAVTQRIRLGSGGVMLQHYSPYKVAENFNLLSALAPGRIDLGIGRAPGGLPNSTRALQRGVTEPITLNEKLAELERYLSGSLPEDHPLAGIKVTPKPEVAPDLILLGASVASAELAAELGLPYVFALFINSDLDVAEQALTVYRERFDPAKGTAPRALLALSVLVAETEAQAAELAEELKNVKIKLESGRTVTVGTLEQAAEFVRQANEPYEIEVKEADVTKGTKDQVRARLLELQARYEVDEFIVTTAIKGFDLRKRSVELLSEAFAPIPQT
ncbi:LLM class flavin-dependent oxidoreductase [Cohnella fermenti]|uniref:LLM class flavin-dependent oxidoreductase n=1 Tax=Cohnella fermenti TaxID=2565925 RepID=A0A4V3WGC2_9BACL|nr:LLM class flavin-dependent oxidoreductase [Cohnella fermenti]THF83673.1 LLM class flavin-dependent oxidoreductase [Cohnella fermenti]